MILDVGGNDKTTWNLLTKTLFFFFIFHQQNRNASSPMSNQTLMISYSAAVGSALTVAFGLATFIQRRYPAAQAKALMKYVAFPSAVVASSLNCYIVRSPEIETGIPLTDANGNNVMEGSTSQEAARRGVNSTTVSRALLQAPVYFLPPVLMGVLPPFQKMIQNNPRTRVPLTTFLLLVSFGVGLPVTTAIFPQIAEMDANDAEPKFQHLVDPKTQQPYKVFYYNKGL
jgi:sideroflexin-5